MVARLGLIVGLWLLMAAGAAAKERTWTSVDGRTMRGEFLRELGDEVALLVDGKLVTIPLDRLSPRDQQAVRDLAAGKEVVDDPPAPAPPIPAPSPQPVTPVPANPESAPPPAAVDDSVVDVTPTPAAAPPTAASEPEPEERSAPAASLTPGRRPKAAANRTWTDTQGRQVSGKFVRVFNGKVMISRPGGIVPVGFYDLSDADQKYVKEVLVERGEESLIPPKPVPQGTGGLASGTAPMEAASSIPAGAIEIAPSFPEFQNSGNSGAGAIEYGGSSSPNYGSSMNSGSSYNPGSVEVMPATPGPTYSMPPSRPRFNPSPAEDTSEERVGICSGCNREVRGIDTFMNKCPHCGTRWSYNEFNDGERAGQLADRLGGAAIAAVAAVVVATLLLAGVIGVVMAIAKASRGGQQYKHPRYNPPRY